MKDRLQSQTLQVENAKGRNDVSVQTGGRRKGVEKRAIWLIVEAVEFGAQKGRVEIESVFCYARCECRKWGWGEKKWEEITV